ncbi:MAG: trehalase family glycosidase [bacterium]
MSDLEKKAIAVLHTNRREIVKQGVKYGFTCPSPTAYHWQWLWDSCFHAIALRWNEPDFAKGELLSLLSGQWEDGRIPNMVHIGKNWRFDSIIHNTGRDTSGITQPPIIADAAMRVHAVSPDKGFLEKAYGPLVSYYEWLGTKREPKNDGLIEIYHPWESGIDNSPRWDSIFHIRRFHRKLFDLTKGRIMLKFTGTKYDNEGMKRVSPYLVRGIDMNCYYYANLKAMAAMARELGKPAEADAFEQRAQKTADAVMKRMWSEEKQMFGDLIGRDEKLSVVPTLFSFMPLWAGLVSDERAKIMVGQLTDTKRFWTKYPVPTTDLTHPMFDPEGYWRGTVWINTNWFMIEGLARYGYNDIAQDVKERTLKMVDAGGIREYYNPLTGEGLGAKSFAWSTLVIDLMHRDYSKKTGSME